MIFTKNEAQCIGILILPQYLRTIINSSFTFIATLRIAGALEKSTEVMKSMQALVKMPEIQATMRDMSKEMMKVTT